MAPCQEHSGLVTRIDSIEVTQEKLLLEMQKMNSNLNSIWHGEGNAQGIKERLNNLEAFTKKAKYFAYGATTVFFLQGTPYMFESLAKALRGIIL